MSIIRPGRQSSCPRPEVPGLAEFGRSHLLLVSTVFFSIVESFRESPIHLDNIEIGFVATIGHDIV